MSNHHICMKSKFWTRQKTLRQSLFGVLALMTSACASQTGTKTETVMDDKTTPAYLSLRELARGQIDCFEAGTLRDDKPDALAYCETSAVVRVDGKFWVASDKGLPQKNEASIFALTVSPRDTTLARIEDSEQQASPFNLLRKIEAMASSSSDGWTFASTAFDRVSSEKPSWDAFNSLLAWPAGKPHDARIVEASLRDGVTSSVTLRKGFTRALSDAQWPEGPPYFKVEGLAALPGQRLLFGVREAGASYKDFDYQIRLIEARYRVEGDQVRIDPDAFKEVYRAAPTIVAGHRLAVSSLLYDAKRKLLWMLTSFEEEEGGLGAFLMHAPADDFARASAWSLVRTLNSTEPFLFANKAEGMEFIDPDSIVVIFDEDRRLNRGATPELPTRVAREAHQGAYMLVRIVEE